MQGALSFGDSPRSPREDAPGTCILLIGTSFRTSPLYLEEDSSCSLQQNEHALAVGRDPCVLASCALVTRNTSEFCFASNGVRLEGLALSELLDARSEGQLG